MAMAPFQQIWLESLLRMESGKPSSPTLTMTPCSGSEELTINQALGCKTSYVKEISVVDFPVAALPHVSPT